MFSWVKQKLFDSPLIRTIIDVLATTIISFFTGLLTFDITKDGEIIWTDLYRSWSCYILILSISLYCIYTKLTYDIDKDIQKFKDDDFCRAYVRSKCIPALANKYSDMIKNGNLDDLKQARSEVDRILK
jgi:hypothetical protein